MLVVDYDFSFTSASIVDSRRLTEEERAQYEDWFQAIGLVAIGESIALPELHMADMPQRNSDGAFLGTNNRAWTITDAEAAALIALNAERAEAKAAAEKADRITYLESVITRAERQKELPSREQKSEMLRAYNRLQNEGGEGFSPWIITREEYEAAMAELKNLKEE